jgi:hypothetical protein
MLKSVRSYNFSEKIYEREPEVAGSVLVDQSYYDAVHQGMWGLTNDKSNDVYGAFADCAVQVACKTGTAQLGEDRMNNAVFVCYAPYEDPEIAWPWSWKKAAPARPLRGLPGTSSIPTSASRTPTSRRKPSSPC